MSSRFPSKESCSSHGSRGPSAMRLSTPTLQSSAARRSLSTPKDFTRLPSPAAATTSRQKKEAMRCCICSTELASSGNGLSICTRCRGVHLSSGRVSHLWAVKNGSPTPVQDETVRANDNYSIDLGHNKISNPLANRQAWRRLSEQAHVNMCNIPSLDHAQNGDSAGEPIFAGIVNTGYVVGDRVKSSVRLPRDRDSKGDNWDFLSCDSTDEGVVIGPGHVAGEIMIKFDHNRRACSMRMDKIERVSEKEPTTNCQRAANRRRSTSCLGSVVGRSQVAVY